MKNFRVKGSKYNDFNKVLGVIFAVWLTVLSFSCFKSRNTIVSIDMNAAKKSVSSFLVQGLKQNLEVKDVANIFFEELEKFSKQNRVIIVDKLFVFGSKDITKIIVNRVYKSLKKKYIFDLGSKKWKHLTLKLKKIFK